MEVQGVGVSCGQRRRSSFSRTYFVVSLFSLIKFPSTSFHTSGSSSTMCYSQLAQVNDRHKSAHFIAWTPHALKLGISARNLVSTWSYVSLALCSLELKRRAGPGRRWKCPTNTPRFFFLLTTPIRYINVRKT
jgi:hypothetical protein